MRLALVLAIIPAHAWAKPCHGAHAAIESMSRPDAHTLRLCWQSPDACFTFDLDAKSPAWTLAAKTKLAPGGSSAIPGVTVGMTVNLCRADGSCRDFVVPPGPVTTFSPTFALANADRSVIAAVTGRTITLFDGKGGKRGAIESWKPEVGIGWSYDGLWFHGDRIYVELSAGRDAELRVFDTKGVKVADLGAVARTEPLQLAGGTFAIATASGDKLELRDDTRARRIDVFGPSQERVAYVALAAGGQVAVARGDGSVALVDTAAGTHVVVAPPPVCK